MSKFAFLWWQPERAKNFVISVMLGLCQTTLAQISHRWSSVRVFVLDASGSIEACRTPDWFNSARLRRLNCKLDKDEYFFINNCHTFTANWTGRELLSHRHFNVKTKQLSTSFSINYSFSPLTCHLPLTSNSIRKTALVEDSALSIARKFGTLSANIHSIRDIENDLFTSSRCSVAGEWSCWYGASTAIRAWKGLHGSSFSSRASEGKPGHKAHITWLDIDAFSEGQDNVPEVKGSTSTCCTNAV